MYSVTTSREDCDYCLLQCLECGAFKGIYKPRKGNTNNWIQIKGESPLIISSTNSYEEIRKEYLNACLEKREKEVIKIFRKRYKTI